MKLEPEKQPPCVDVIVPTRNRGELIVRTLCSLSANLYPDFHVWIVDQSDGTETAEIVKRIVGQDGRFVHLPMAAKGVDVARNYGLRAGSAPIVAFIDDDCQAAPDWVEALVDEFQSDPQIWGVFGKVIPGEENPKSLSADRDDELERLARVLPMAMKISAQHKVYQNNRFDLGFGHGANMSFRREVFDRVGMFDELLGAGSPLRSFPERDMGYRILSRSGRIAYAPRVVVHHYHWRQFQKVKDVYRNYAIGAGAAAGKYLRCGDLGGAYLLFEWIIDQGIRQVLSGIFKWHSWEKIQIGFLQMIFPWLGILYGFRYRVDRNNVLYIPG